MHCCWSSRLQPDDHEPSLDETPTQAENICARLLEPAEDADEPPADSPIRRQQAAIPVVTRRRKAVRRRAKGRHRPQWHPRRRLLLMSQAALGAW